MLLLVRLTKCLVPLPALQETYPEVPPVWFSESEETFVSTIVQTLSESEGPDNYVSLSAIVRPISLTPCVADHTPGSPSSKGALQGKWDGATGRQSESVAVAREALSDGEQHRLRHQLRERRRCYERQALGLL